MVQYCYSADTLIPTWYLGSCKFGGDNHHRDGILALDTAQSIIDNNHYLQNSQIKAIRITFRRRNHTTLLFHRLLNVHIHTKGIIFYLKKKKRKQRNLFSISSFENQQVPIVILRHECRCLIWKISFLHCQRREASRSQFRAPKRLVSTQKKLGFEVESK